MKLAFDQASAWIAAVVLTGTIFLITYVNLPQDSITEEELEEIAEKTVPSLRKYREMAAQRKAKQAQKDKENEDKEKAGN